MPTVPAKKTRRWKRIILALLTFKLISLSIYVWKMHRPLGTPLSGVRLSAIYAQTTDDVAPGSFYSLLERSVVEFERIALTKEEQKRLSALVSSRFCNWRSEDYPDLAKLMARCRPAFDLMAQASLMPFEQAYAPMPGYQRGQGKTVLASDAMLHPLAVVFKLSFLMQTEACQRIALGEVDEAEKLITTLLNLGARLSRGGGTFGLLIADNVNLNGLRALMVMAEGNPSTKSVAALQALATQQATARPPFAEVLREEYGYLKAAFADPDFVCGDGTTWQVPNWLVGSEPENNLRDLDVIFSEIIASAAASPDRFDLKMIEAKYLSGTEEDGLLIKSNPKLRLVMKAMGRFFTTSFDIQQNDLAKSRASLTSLALHRFKSLHQRWPTTLSEALSPVPLDPYDQSPLRYQLNLDGHWLIYSIGKNGIDDGGTFSKNPLALAGYDVGLSSNEQAQAKIDFESALAKQKPR